MGGVGISPAVSMSRGGGYVHGGIPVPMVYPPPALTLVVATETCAAGKRTVRILMECFLVTYHFVVLFFTVPSAVLNLSEGTVSEISITVSWSRNTQSLQDKFQVNMNCNLNSL